MKLFVLKNGKKARIAERVRIAGTMLERFKGLMLEKQENFDYALVFELPFESRRGASIHTFFMRFPIDLLFLDSEKRIVDLRENLYPWVLNFTPRKPAKFVIEMKAGLAGKFRLKLGERIVF